MNPTVSLMTMELLQSRFNFLVVVSRVANNLSSTNTSDSVRVCISVDFPALVYPTREIRKLVDLLEFCVVRCFSIFLSSYFGLYPLLPGQ